MGSIPNGSAPLQACAGQIFNLYATGPHPKAQVRLAAAVRLRIAVALELVAG
jgi:hypothetical protein